MNFWNILFIASLAQGFFQIDILILGKRLKTIPSRLIFWLLIFLVLINLEFFFLSSGLYKKFPHLFGLSYGLIFLIGPSLYFYVRSIIEEKFIFKKIYFLHLFFFVLYYILGFSLFTSSASEKIKLSEYFLTAKVYYTGFEYFLIFLQVGHVAVYLTVTEIYLRKKQKTIKLEKQENRDRLSWVKLVRWLFTGFLMFLIFLELYFITKGYYTIIAGYLYTLLYSLIIYTISTVMYYKPQMVLGERAKKYKKSVMDNPEVDIYVAKLEKLMKEDKIYTEPDLKLNEVADQLGVSVHFLSQLLNEKFNRTFLDYVNYFRVEALKASLADPNKAHLTLLSLAMDAGFNSKSAYNNTFKRFTGKTPTEYKKLIANGNNV
jgi:AraC-like DNA-binding protein